MVVVLFAYLCEQEETMLETRNMVQQRSTNKDDLSTSTQFQEEPSQLATNVERKNQGQLMGGGGQVLKIIQLLAVTFNEENKVRTISSRSMLVM